MIGAQVKSPGPKYALPGALGTTDHDLRKAKAAAYSFGTRHRIFSADCSPGPSHFVKPNITRKGRDGTPQYSLYGRHRPIKVLPVMSLPVPLVLFRTWKHLALEHINQRK